MTSSPAHRADRARRAELSLNEFFAPAIEMIRGAYQDRLKQVCANEPWSTNKIASLANAARIVDEIEKQFRMLVLEGEEARRELIRVEQIEKLSAQRRRVLGL